MSFASSSKSRRSISVANNSDFSSEFNHNPNRGEWKSTWQFMTAYLGQSVGIRNLFLFCYFYETCGGLAFLCAVCLLSPLLAVPCFFQESFMGQFSRTGFVSVFRIIHICKGLGFVMLNLNLGSVIYFSVISAYPLVFIYKLFTYETPWNIEGNNTTRNFLFHDSDPVNCSSFHCTSPITIYFLQKTKEFEIGWSDSSFIISLILFVAIIWIAVLCCVFAVEKSINLIVKLVYGTTSIASIILFILTLRNLFSFGNVPGISFFNFHDFYHLGDIKTWMGAGIVVLHTLSKSWGLITAFGSFNVFRHPLKFSVKYMPYAAILLNFLGIIPALIFGNFLKSIGISTSNVMNGGFNLAFVLYSDFIASVGESQAWSICFYVMVFLFEFNGILLQTISIITSHFDEFACTRMRYSMVVTTFCICMGLFSVGLASKGMYTPCDQLIFYSILAQLIGFFTEHLIFTYSFVNKGRFAFDIKFVFGPDQFYKHIQKLVTMVPLWIGTLILYWSIVGMPFLPPQTNAWSEDLTTTFFGLCLVWFPGYIIFGIVLGLSPSMKKLPLSTRIRESIKPIDWHPADSMNYVGYMTEKSINNPPKNIRRRRSTRVTSF